jgi:DNA-binding response OmpR family regulator
VSESKRVVFVVDDEPAIAQTLAMILNQSGFAAIAFEDPHLAIEAAGAIKPDLLISDVMMPGMTGVRSI